MGPTMETHQPINLQTTSAGPSRTYSATCNCITKSILGAKLENSKAKINHCLRVIYDSFFI